jgi:hypothetical protein
MKVKEMATLCTFVAMPESLQEIYTAEMILKYFWGINFSISSKNGVELNTPAKED